MDGIQRSQGYRITALEPGGEERVVIEIPPDSGGRGSFEHGTCNVVMHLRKIQELRREFGEAGIASEVQNLGRYVFAWLYEVGQQGR